LIKGFTLSIIASLKGALLMVRMPHWPKTLWQRDVKYDLSRVKSLLEILGNPHLRLPPVIHIAGTNGKGSTTAFLKNIFEKAGYKAHVYTSPHLIEFNERIVVSSKKISDAMLFEVVEKVRWAAEQLLDKPTFFEATTVIALLSFAENPADIVILETGMGGRLDATNIIDNPIATIITPISYDHMEYLGPTLPIIAREKAGIIKADAPCIISNQTPEIYEVLFEECEKRGATAIAFQYDYGLERVGQDFKFVTKDYNLNLPKLSLAGEHQYLNASNAIACVKFIKGFNIKDQHIIEGLKSANWPARLQRVESGQFYEILGPKFEIWVDGAHNEAGAQMLSHWVRDNKKTPLYMIWGMTKNRDARKFMKYFERIAQHVCGVLIEAEPSSYPAIKLKELIQPLNINYSEAESIEDAVRQIALMRRETGGVLLVTGSLFLAGDFLRLSNISI
jgi:dihydrofolate synthase/folylpolyglutamate synthase